MKMELEGKVDALQKQLTDLDTLRLPSNRWSDSKCSSAFKHCNGSRYCNNSHLFSGSVWRRTCVLRGSRGRACKGLCSGSRTTASSCARNCSNCRACTRSVGKYGWSMDTLTNAKLCPTCSLWSDGTGAAESEGGEAAAAAQVWAAGADPAGDGTAPEPVSAAATRHQFTPTSDIYGPLIFIKGPN